MSPTLNATRGWLKKYFRMSSAPIPTYSPSPFIFIPQPSVYTVIPETPATLKQKISTHADSVDYLGKIYVTSATFCKQKHGANHEFLVFHIQDALDDTRKTVMVLDRVPQNEPSTPPNKQDVEDQGKVSPEDRKTPKQDKRALSMSARPQSSWAPFSQVIFTGSTPAADMFFISTCNDLVAICNGRGLINYEEIETLTINHQNLAIEQIIVLANTISDHCPTYNLYRNQCYWYAGVIWEIVQTLAYPDGSTCEITQSKKKGTNQLLPFLSIKPTVDAEDGASALRSKYDKAWHKFCEDVAPLRGKGSSAMATQIDCHEAQIRKLEAEIIRLRTKAD